RWRGCAYQHHEDDPIDIIWLTAGELRRDGDHDDAYNHFIRLHESGHLHPTPEDLLVAFTEELIWYVIPRAADNAVDVIRDALGDPEVPYESMDPTLP